MMLTRFGKLREASQHATVPVGEYTVPLIGIPPSATQEKCSRCGVVGHLKDMVLDGKGEPCCFACADAKYDPKFGDLLGVPHTDACKKIGRMHKGPCPQ